MNINIIATMAKNRVIGLNGKLPWRIPENLNYFNKLTSGKGNGCLMGFNTWKSIPGYPDPQALPNRGKFIISKNNKHLIRANVISKYPLDYKDFQLPLYQKCYPNIWICGGQSIYEFYINKPYINRIYLTNIERDFKGDTFFPIIPDHFVLEDRTQTNYQLLHALEYYGYSFNVYKNTEYEPISIENDDYPYQIYA